MSLPLKTVKELLDAHRYPRALKELGKIPVDCLSSDERAEYEMLFGIALFETGHIDEAIDRYKRCVQIAKDECRHFNLYAPYYELSLLHFSVYCKHRGFDDLEKAIDYCKLALDIAINSSFVKRTSGFEIYYEDSPEAFIDALIHLAVLYQTQGKLQESIDILLVSKTICQHYSRFGSLGQVYDELGTSHALLGNMEMASYYFLKSVKAKEVINNVKGIEITIHKHIMLSLSHPEMFLGEKVSELKHLISEECI